MTTRMKFLLVGLLALIVAVAGFFFYLSVAFPKVRCEGANHLDAPEQFADCVTCHTQVTAKVTQDWMDSKHGVMLVKCVVCHGEPDGKGSIAFTATPDPMDICARCHDPSIQRMIAKYGEIEDCNTCHPNHQNPMHGEAYENKIPTSRIAF